MSLCRFILLILAFQIGINPVGPAWGDELRNALKQVKSADYEAVLPSLHDKAEAGDVLSQGALGMMYFDGIGVPIRHSAAMNWLNKAAQVGSPSAMYRLGLAFSGDSNEICGNDPQSNSDTSNAWFDKAFKQSEQLLRTNSSSVVVTMSHLLLEGRGSVAKDPVRGATAFTQSTCGGDLALIPCSRYGFGRGFVGHSRRCAW